MIKLKKLPTDFAQRAKAIVDLATGQTSPPEPDKKTVVRASKGGKGRSSKLSAERRSEIARKAAAKRWG